MDFKNFDTISAAEKGFTYAFLDWDGNETDVTIDVIGVGSRVFNQAKARIDAAETKAKSRGKPMDDDTSNALWVDLLAKCTKGWKNVEEDGKEVPFNYDNAVRMYTAYPPLRNQVLAAIYDIRSMVEGN